MDELIELSYLLTLRDCDIKNYLASYISTCESVISRNVSMHGDMRAIKIKVAVLRAKAMIEEDRSYYAAGYIQDGKQRCLS